MGQKSRKPSYSSGTNLARVTLRLSENPFGLRLKKLALDLGVGQRTIDRYIDVLKAAFRDPIRGEQLEVVGEGDMRMLRFKQKVSVSDGSAYQAAMLYFALRVLRFLEGTSLNLTVEGLWDRICKSLTPTQMTRVRDFERKFYAVQYAPKDYHAYDDQLDCILRALLDGKRLRIEYRAMNGAENVHEFDPFTLVEYRGGLYLLGRSNRGERPIYLAVERMRSVAFATDASGTEIRFALPPNYRPSSFIEGTFGILDGPQTRVKIKIASPETLTYLSSRLIHPTQKFVPTPDGATVLEMNVRGTTELANWIMGFGAYLEVLEPAELRTMIAERHAKAAALYAAPRRGRAATKRR